MSEMTACHPLCTEIETRLAIDGPSEAALHAILDRLLSTFGCSVGTVHRLDRDTGMLRLCVHRGLPAALLERVQLIPIGKGMAGLAAERRVPVQVCNLQTDTSGAAKPAAKETGMRRIVRGADAPGRSPVRRPRSGQAGRL